VTEVIAASHDVLFADPAARQCDACGAPVPECGGDEEDAGLPGQGVYLSARGGEVRLERVPLCPSCASAIGMTALARWEIEEDEG
jgi:hypothetical protein